MTDAARSRIAAPPPVGAVDRRQFLYGGALVATAAAATALAPRRATDAIAAGTLDRAIPKTIGPYRFLTESGLVTPQADEISQRIYDEVLTRVYAAPGLPNVMLLIAYGSAQDAGLQLHRPEYCYAGAGFALSGERTVPLAGVGDPAARATLLTATRADHAEQILFWTRIGDRYPMSGRDEKLSIFAANLRGVLPDGVLVRMSTTDASPAAALPALQRFNAALVGSLGADGRHILIGTPR